MNPEKLTTTLQEAIAEAQQIAVTRHHQEIDIPHLWKVFLTPQHFARNFYQDAGVDVTALEAKVDELLDQEVEVAGNVSYGQNMSQNLYRLLQESNTLKDSFSDEYLSTEIVLLGLMTLKNYPLTTYLKYRNN